MIEYPLMVENARAEHKEIPIETTPIIIKIGGQALLQGPAFAEDIATLHQKGLPIIIVHGGGNAIDDELRRRGKISKKIDGVRVTDQEVLQIAVDVLSEINEELVNRLLAADINALGVNGRGIKLLKADIKNPNLGLVGRVKKVNKVFLEDKLLQGIVPVVSPISYTAKGGVIQLLNTNADAVSGAIAASFPGSKLLILSDVKGVEGKEGRVIRELDYNKYQILKAKGLISEGMIPKIDAAFDALRNGSSPRVINGLISHAILHALEYPSSGTNFVE